MPARGLIMCLLALLAPALSATASPLNYQPVNPSFGGSPLNGNWLQSQATAQNIFVRQKQIADAMAQQIAQQQQQARNTTSTASNFAAVINARLLAAVADRITNAIFGENAQQSGTFVIQGTTIQFQQVGLNVQISVNDGATVSTVTVPLGF